MSQVAIVTGVAGGIGRAVAKLLSAEYAVLGVDRETVADDLNLSASVAADVCEWSDCQSIAEAATGLGDVGCIVHCAGISAPPAMVDEMPLEDWDRVINVNLNGSFRLMRACVPLLKASGSGSIVLISSSSGRRPWATKETGEPSPKAHYCASKAGVISLTQSLAFELARFNIRANCIAPGPTATEMIPQNMRAYLTSLIPMGRLAEAEEIAQVAAFLCSPQSSFVTGQTVDVNGGVMMY